MTSIYFVGPYPPIMCGIATYTDYLTRRSPHSEWGVLSFDLKTYGAPLTSEKEMPADRVWYGIPSRSDFSATAIMEGLDRLGARAGDAILWFQHETAIWADNEKFVGMLKELLMPKVVSFHTLHFQSDETPSGLRKYQYDLLRKVLPHVDAITVFTYGVYRAVISAFPEYYARIYVAKHGVHSYPEISRLSRREAREKLCDFLLYESDLDQSTKAALYKQSIFSDPNAVLLGQTGFLCPLKHSESLYFVRDSLQQLIPQKRVIAVRIGTAREEAQRIYARHLRSELNDPDTVLIETWLPPDILPLAQRAFDVNFYWPDECTQSGVVAHALGAGAIVAGRDLEGLGETLKEAGQLTDTDIKNLTLKIKYLLLDPELGEKTKEKALNYAEEFSWENQAIRHYELAEPILHTMALWEKSRLPSAMDTLAASVARKTKANVPIHIQQLSDNQLPSDIVLPKRSNLPYQPNRFPEGSLSNETRGKLRKRLFNEIIRLTKWRGSGS